MLDHILPDLPPSTRELLLRTLAVLVALIIIYFARRIVTLVIMLPLKRLTGRIHTNTSERLLDIILGPVRMILIALALTISAQLLIPNDTFFRGLISVITRVMVIFAALTVSYRLIDLLLPTSNQLASMTGIRIEERLVPFLRVGIKLFVVAIGIVIIIQELGYDVSGLIAGIGIGGLAISLAAQDTIANLFGFASIVGDSPFSIGEYVKTPDAEGTVEHVGLRSTRLRQLDQTLITVPNNKLANSAISNMSRMMKRRIDFTVRLTYATSNTQMRDVLTKLRDTLNDWPSVEPNSAQVFFSKFNEYSLDILIRCFVRKQTWAEMMAEQEAIFLAVMDIIEESGLDIAIPPMR